MNHATHLFLCLDLPQVLTAVLAAATCALLGNFLLLRRLSLMGDAISHSVLPGLVGGFLIIGSRGTLPMFLGAAVAGVVTVGLVEIVKRLGRVESGAAMGVVFSIMFALGIVLIRAASAQGVDLDPDCVLNGLLETVYWPVPTEWSQVWSFDTLATMPRQTWTLLGVFGVSLGVVVAIFKELRITCFDQPLAASLGLRPGLINGVLMLLVAVAVVASFEAVGSVLVIAMLIVPPAAARLLTDRLQIQVILSVLLGIATAVLGHVIASNGPAWVSGDVDAGSLSAAGTITVVSGILLVASMVLAPHHGLVGRAARRWSLAMQVTREDVLGMLYRAQEGGLTITAGNVAGALAFARGGSSRVTSAGWRDRVLTRFALRSLIITGQACESEGGNLSLTRLSSDRATRLVRTHRLWETYLVKELGLRPDHVHRTAMDLEHFTTDEMSEALGRETPQSIDPHARQIPPA